MQYQPSYNLPPSHSQIAFPQTSPNDVHKRFQRMSMQFNSMSNVHALAGGGARSGAGIGTGQAGGSNGTVTAGRWTYGQPRGRYDFAPNDEKTIAALANSREFPGPEVGQEVVDSRTGRRYITEMRPKSMKAGLDGTQLLYAHYPEDPAWVNQPEPTLIPIEAATASTQRAYPPLASNIFRQSPPDYVNTYPSAYAQQPAHQTQAYPPQVPYPYSPSHSQHLNPRPQHHQQYPHTQLQQQQQPQPLPGSARSVVASDASLSSRASTPTAGHRPGDETMTRGPDEQAYHRQYGGERAFMGSRPMSVAASRDGYPERGYGVEEGGYDGLPHGVDRPVYGAEDRGQASSSTIRQYEEMGRTSSRASQYSAIPTHSIARDVAFERGDHGRYRKERNESVLSSSGRGEYDRTPEETYMGRGDDGETVESEGRVDSWRRSGGNGFSSGESVASRRRSALPEGFRADMITPSKPGPGSMQRQESYTSSAESSRSYRTSASKYLAGTGLTGSPSGHRQSHSIILSGGRAGQVRGADRTATYRSVSRASTMEPGGDGTESIARSQYGIGSINGSVSGYSSKVRRSATVASSADQYASLRARKQALADYDGRPGTAVSRRQSILTTPSEKGSTGSGHPDSRQRRKELLEDIGRSARLEGRASALRSNGESILRSEPRPSSRMDSSLRPSTSMSHLRDGTVGSTRSEGMQSKLFRRSMGISPQTAALYAQPDGLPDSPLARFHQRGSIRSARSSLPPLSLNRSDSGSMRNQDFTRVSDSSAMPDIAEDRRVSKADIGKQTPDILACAELIRRSIPRRMGQRSSIIPGSSSQGSLEIAQIAAMGLRDVHSQTTSLQTSLTEMQEALNVATASEGLGTGLQEDLKGEIQDSLQIAGQLLSTQRLVVNSLADLLQSFAKPRSDPLPSSTPPVTAIPDLAAKELSEMRGQSETQGQTQASDTAIPSADTGQSAMQHTLPVENEVKSAAVATNNGDAASSSSPKLSNGVPFPISNEPPQEVTLPEAKPRNSRTFSKPAIPASPGLRSRKSSASSHHGVTGHLRRGSDSSLGPGTPTTAVSHVNAEAAIQEETPTTQQAEQDEDYFRSQPVVSTIDEHARLGMRSAPVIDRVEAGETDNGDVDSRAPGIRRFASATESLRGLAMK